MDYIRMIRHRENVNTRLPLTLLSYSVITPHDLLLLLLPLSRHGIRRTVDLVPPLPRITT